MSAYGYKRTLSTGLWNVSFPPGSGHWWGKNASGVPKGKTPAPEVQTQQGNPSLSSPRHQAKNHHAGHIFVTHISVTYLPHIRDVPNILTACSQESSIASECKYLLIKPSIGVVALVYQLPHRTP